MFLVTIPIFKSESSLSVVLKEMLIDCALKVYAEEHF